MPDRIAWEFYDPETDTTYLLPVNPNDGGSPGFTKTMTYTNTSAPDGKTIAFEGRDEVQKLEFSGVILDQPQYDAFVTWWRMRRQVRVTDDLDRVFWIYFTSFIPKRKRAYLRPWKHEYNAEALIVDWETS